MATTVGTLNPETPLSRRIIIWIIALVGIFVFTGLLLAFNYWVAVVFFFVSLLTLIRFGLEEHQWRGLALLFFTCLFLAVIVGSLALLVLSNDARIPQLAQSGSLANFFLGSNIRIVFTSVLIGLIAPLPLIIIPFLLLVTVTTFGILQWHKKDQIVSTNAFWYIVFGLLGILHFSITVEDGEVKGTEKDKARLNLLGGPGWLTVYPGRVVVLHRWGKVTRVVGLGSTMLKREEQIKAIVPLTGQGGIHPVEKVLTRDRIPLDINVFYAVQMEPAADTKVRFQQAVADAKVALEKVKAGPNPVQDEIKTAEQKLKDAEQRLKNLEKDKIIGDEYNRCYESIARLVTAKGTKIWDGAKNPVANNLRDAIMSEYFEKLFIITEDSENLDARIDQRRIKEIEGTIFERAKKAKIEDGVLLRVVDIHQVRFPEKIEKKINEEVETLIEERIQQTRVRLEESKSKSTVIVARAKAQAKILEGQSEGESRAAEIREVLRELKRENLLPKDQVANAVVELISSRTSVKELERFVKATALTNQRQVRYDDMEQTKVRSTGD